MWGFACAMELRAFVTGCMLRAGEQRGAVALLVLVYLMRLPLRVHSGYWSSSVGGARTLKAWWLTDTGYT